MGQGDEWQHGPQAESSSLDALGLGNFVRRCLYTDHFDADQEKGTGAEACQEPQSSGKHDIAGSEERQDVCNESDGDGNEEAFVGTDFVKDESGWQLDEAVRPEQSAEKEGQSGIADSEKRHKLRTEWRNTHEKVA